MPVIYTDESKVIAGITYYKLLPQEDAPYIGVNVWAAKTASIGARGQL